MNTNISNIEQTFFNNLKSYIPDIKQQLSLGNYLYDIYYDKKIIEFNGDYWHGNPEIYMFEDYVGTIIDNKPTYAYEIWAKDQRKYQFAESNGYDVLVVWESDYKKYPFSTIKKCLNFFDIPLDKIPLFC